ncbi:MAG: CAP domain-containing protein, partial [Pseudarthrobacter sp.]
MSATGPSSVTLGASAINDNAGSSSGADSGGSLLAPAVEPDIRPASPTDPLAAEPVAVGPVAAEPLAPAPATSPSAATVEDSPEPAAPAPVPASEEPAPEVPSIPPLWAPDEELASPPASRQAAPESLAAVPAPEALIPDSNAAAILTVFNRINEYRASKGLNPVKYNATVAALAQEWSDSIATREVIEHRASFWTDQRALSPNN